MKRRSRIVSMGFKTQAKHKVQGHSLSCMLFHFVLFFTWIIIFCICQSVQVKTTASTKHVIFRPVMSLLQAVSCCCIKVTSHLLQKNNRSTLMIFSSPLVTLSIFLFNLTHSQERNKLVWQGHRNLAQHKDGKWPPLKQATMSSRHCYWTNSPALAIKLFST